MVHAVKNFCCCSGCCWTFLHFDLIYVWECAEYIWPFQIGADPLTLNNLWFDEIGALNILTGGLVIGFYWDSQPNNEAWHLTSKKLPNLWNIVFINRATWKYIGKHVGIHEFKLETVKEIMKLDIWNWRDSDFAEACYVNIWCHISFIIFTYRLEFISDFVNMWKI